MYGGKTISIKFIVELPKSAGFDIVIMVINLVSKIIYLIFTYTMVSAKEVARLFLHNV